MKTIVLITSLFTCLFVGHAAPVRAAEKDREDRAEFLEGIVLGLYEGKQATSYKKIIDEIRSTGAE
jgi:hypothetical protein